MKKAEEIESVQQWQSSGQTQKAYCQTIGIKRSTFANWVARSKEKPKSGFLAITPPTQPVPENIELVYPNGVRLKTTASAIHLFSELIQAWPCSV